MSGRNKEATAEMADRG